MAGNLEIGYIYFFKNKYNSPILSTNHNRNPGKGMYLFFLQKNKHISATPSAHSAGGGREYSFNFCKN